MFTAFAMVVNLIFTDVDMLLVHHIQDITDCHEVLRVSVISPITCSMLEKDITESRLTESLLQYLL